MPLGSALALAQVRWWRIWLLGAVLSAAIEYTQLYIPGRDSSVADVISNSTGALVGCTLTFALARTVRGVGRPSSVQALAASGLLLGVIAGTGFLIQPAFPTSRYFAQWTPDLGHLERYRGTVLQAALPDVSLPSGRLTDSRRVRLLLSAGEPLRVRALAGPLVPALAPLFSIFDDQGREVVLLGPDRGDLVFRYRTRAAAWQLDQPDLRAVGAMRAAAPGDTLEVGVRRTGHGYCLTLNAKQTCHLGFTVGNGWGLLLYPGSLHPWIGNLLSVGWVTILLLPVGYWGASRGGLAIGVGMALAGLGFVGPALGLLATPAPQWAGAVIGFLAGSGCREVLIRRRSGPRFAAPDSNARTNSPRQRSILA